MPGAHAFSAILMSTNLVDWALRFREELRNNYNTKPDAVIKHLLLLFAEFIKVSLVVLIGVCANQPQHWPDGEAISSV